MAHALAFRSGQAGNVSQDGLGVAGLEVLGRGPCRATDLADQDHGRGRGIIAEQAQQVDEPEAGDGVAADPDGRRLAQAGPGQLVNRFVGQRSRARGQPDRAGPMDGAPA